MAENLRLDLTWLLDPIPPSTFFRDYWEEKPLLISRNRKDYYAPLLTLEAADAFVTVKPPDAVSVANSDAHLEDGGGADAAGFDIVGACQLFAGGTTAIIRDVHNTIEQVAVLCRALEREISAPFQTNLYITPPGGQGFEAHYDTHDVFVLQVAGSKEWTVLDAPVRLPLNGQQFDPKLHPTGAATLSTMLRAGDLLYIPRGFLHHARSADETSLHATVGALSYRWADVLLEVIAQKCLADPAFRRSLPVGFARTGFDAASTRQAFADLLLRACANANPDHALERLANEFVVGRRALIPGQLTQLSLARGLVPTDEVGVRPTTLYRMQSDGDMVRIRAHGREIILSAEAAEAATFALENDRYRIRDVPGDLDDEEKVMLVKRLIEEGLVWRLPGR